MTVVLVHGRPRLSRGGATQRWKAGVLKDSDHRCAGTRTRKVVKNIIHCCHIRAVALYPELAGLVDNGMALRSDLHGAIDDKTCAGLYATEDWTWAGIYADELKITGRPVNCTRTPGREEFLRLDREEKLRAQSKKPQA